MVLVVVEGEIGQRPDMADCGVCDGGGDVCSGGGRVGSGEAGGGVENRGDGSVVLVRVQAADIGGDGCCR
ncbi:leucine-rich repeat extensin-like protein 3 [Iris pallida]|uniref:Leucine-rich repeat extensin-like protein 3 n=1 Tax=Iris pallida TaxID=29817 RepID=A0AAX6FWC0_IRIPA|nr:leucine-rich repeat extensin-like protein 3 [Iris pallida]KAJ6820282.1 leucine-rich repeat extensin-like protein 3 [Iris pallida]